MHLSRPKPARPLISLVSMIDVLLIMLVFFMVTSTYMHLDMIPMVERSDEETGAGQAGQGEPRSGASLLLSLGADGRILLSGRAQSAQALEAVLAARLDENPDLSVLILPSGHASTQTLVSAMDAVTRAGVTRLRIVELEARQ